MDTYSACNSRTVHQHALTPKYSIPMANPKKKKKKKIQETEFKTLFFIAFYCFQVNSLFVYLLKKLIIKVK